MKKKRVVIISDLHCGHVTGITPPKWQRQLTGNHYWDKYATLQQEMWNYYYNVIKSLKKIDLLIVNGDCIDGRGHRSGGSELLTSDREVQADIASDVINTTKANNIIMTYGTAYHTGDGEDWENIIAKKVGATKIGSHEWIDVNGVIFDCKHDTSSSSTPYSRHSAPAKERMWNLLWSEHDEQPKSDIIIRSHVHYYNFCGGGNWLALTTPALQGMGSKFGSRKCSGHVDFGLIHFDVYEDGSYIWEPHIARIKGQKANVLHI